MIRSLVLISSLALGGAERVTVSFLSRLAGIEVRTAACTVTAKHDGPLAAKLAAAGVIRHDLGARRLADPLAFQRLLRLLHRERIEIVHAHGQDASILGAAARFFLRVPLVLTRHILEEPLGNRSQRLRAQASLAAARRADAVIAVSSAAADWLAKTARLPRDTVRVIPNGIELERFSRDNLSASRAELRAALGFGPDDRLILMPAVFRKDKGHEVLLEALPALKARLPSVRILFAGGGERQAALRLQARSHGDAVRFLGPRGDIPDLLAASDLVVLPSLSEALPTALIEAAAAGRPVVATRVGGVPEVVKDGRTGRLIPPNDPAALVEAVATLLTDNEQARTFGKAARHFAQKRFAIDLQVERTLALWTNVVAGATR